MSDDQDAPPPGEALPTLPQSPAKDAAAAALAKGPEALSERRLSKDQFKELSDLIAKYLEQLTKIEESVQFPPWRVFLVVVLAFACLFWEAHRLLVGVGDASSQSIAIYITKHVTTYIIVLSIAIPIYQISSYIFRQYYNFRKYKMLMTNRIAIFATVLLNGGRVEQSVLSHFISDIPESGDSKDMQTLHEKILDKALDIGKAIADSKAKTKE